MSVARALPVLWDTRSAMGLRVVHLAVLIALAGPSAAASAADVIHVDPGSPAGKEYGFPLDQAHRDAGSRAGGGSGALFGAGIRPLAVTSSGGSTHGARTSHAAGTRQAGGTVKGSERPPATAIPSGTAGGAGGHLDIALVASVVLLGGGLGLILRRRSQHR